MFRVLCLAMLLGAPLLFHSIVLAEILSHEEMKKTRGSAALVHVLSALSEGLRADAVRTTKNNSWMLHAQTSKSSAAGKLAVAAHEAHQRFKSVHSTGKSLYFLEGRLVSRATYSNARDQFLEGLRYRLDIGDIVVEYIKQYYKSRDLMRRNTKSAIRSKRDYLLNSYQVAKVEDLPKEARNRFNQFAKKAYLELYETAANDQTDFVIDFLSKQYNVNLDAPPKSRYPSITQETAGHDFNTIEDFLRQKYGLSVNLWEASSKNPFRPNYTEISVQSTQPMIQTPTNRIKPSAMNTSSPQPLFHRPDVKTSVH